ncbi:MAG: VWA domain-containing protein [Vicinamibacteria bacterium]
MLVAAACAAPLGAQEPPRFPAQAEAITVDVVVLDRDGRPVRGLTRADFALSEDGRPQAIAGFEARERDAPAEAPPLPGPVAAPADLARDGRVFALVIDDLGLSPGETIATRAAVARWIAERADARDELTLVTSSGDVWWSDTVGRGRADFAAVLDRVRGKKTEATLANGAVTEQEAYQIVMVERHGQAGELQSPYGDTASVATGPDAPAAPSQTDRSKTVAERVAVRFLNANLCQLNRASSFNSMVQCYGMAETAAAETYGNWTRRAAAVLRTLQRTAADLRDLPGRKAIVLMSGELLRDRSLDQPFREVIAAAQRANTAVYFGGARGLAASAFGAAENRTSLRAGDVAAMNVEQDVLAKAGAEHLAEATGGAVLASNDLAAGLERMATDASAYYLLGYQPAHPPDGKWHDLELKVARPGVRVRARRTYLSERAGPAVGAGPADASPSLVAGGDRTALPVRAAAHVQAPDGAGGARVLVAIDVDGDRVQVEDGPSGATAQLDLSIAAVARDRASVFPLDQTIDVTLRPSERAGFWSFVREVRLPPGVAQVRTRVRDRRTGLFGAVALRVEVPDVGATYLSSPLVTDRTQPSGAVGEPERLVPSASRRFRADRTLFCQYELFGYAGVGLAGISRVRGGYSITDESGRAVAGEAPTAIATDGSRVVRRLALPLARLAPGRYALTVEVEDQLAGRTFVAREPFEVEAPPLVPADDRRVRVTGRADRPGGGRVRIGYPGVAVQLRFEGASLAMRADAAAPNVYFDVSVDGGAPRVVRLPEGAADVVLAQGLPPGAHAVELVHRNETWQGVVALVGFRTEPGGGLLEPDARPSRRLLFIGDSVTCGENVDRAPDACRKDASHWSAAGSYGLRLARALGAEAHLVCHGGRGLTRDWQGRTDVPNAPRFFELAVPEEGGAAWDHAAYAPDVVVVSLGTNDFSAAAGPLPRREEWVSAYVAFVRQVRTRHPSAGIVLTEGAIVTDDAARPARSVLAACLDDVVRRLGDVRVVHAPTAPHPGDAGDAHPTADQHAEMARELEPSVRALAGW